MRFIKKILQKNIVLILVYTSLGIFNSFTSNFKAFYFQKIIDGLAEKTLILINVVIYGIILITNYSMQYLDNYPAKKLEHGIYLDFKLMALKKISKIDYAEYQQIGTGKLIQRIENGAAAGRDVIFNFWLHIIRELFPTILFSIYFIWRMNQQITYALLLGYGIIFTITNLLLRFLYQIKEKILNNEELLNHYLVRGFMEMLVFRIKKQFPNEMKKAKEAKKIIVSSKVKMTMIHEAFFAIFVLLVAILDVGIIIYAWRQNDLTVGTVVSLITLIENAYMPIAIFNVIYVQYKLDRTSYERFEDFLLLKNDEQLFDGKILQHDIKDILIKNLSFRYKERKIFDNLCLFISKGEKVAFVGESGSGKSTLVKILMGLLKYNKGHIFINGVELSDISLNYFYDKISYLSQDAPIFDGTVRENIVFDKKIPDKDILNVLEKVQLSYLIEGTEKGLDTEIGEKGTRLSGGEKQRLALARLWFEDSEVAILDEATSAMDNLTEENVMREVMLNLAHRTVIVVAHRLNSVIGFKRIIVFREGKLVNQGSFEELIRTDPYFIELYNASIE